MVFPLWSTDPLSNDISIYNIGDIEEQESPRERTK